MLCNIAQWREVIYNTTLSWIVSTRHIVGTCTISRYHIDRCWYNLVSCTCLCWYCHQHELCLRDLFCLNRTTNSLLLIIYLHSLLFRSHPNIYITFVRTTICKRYEVIKLIIVIAKVIVYAEFIC